MQRPRLQNPVLLVGAGSGEATCGILYLAGYLRRAGVEAYVRLYDRDVTEDEIVRSLEALVRRVRPRLVGISLKWFHHVHRAIRIARALRRIDRNIRIVVGGNTASHWWKELAALDCFDHVVLGDGEKPLLAICQGDPAPPNCITRAPDGSPRRLPLAYVQSATNTEDVHYSHFDEIFLSQQDRHAFSGWIAPGKGCAENCLYCGGSSRNQRQAFGRGKTFLRSTESVRQDHLETIPRTWQVRYDFSGSSAAFLEGTWEGIDLSRHSCTYFLWGRPQTELLAALSKAFHQVYMVLDIGCFSETQRKDLMGRGMLKACALDDELMQFIETSRRFPNLEVEVSGIAGLPFASEATLREEVRLVEKVIELGCVGGYQRLESQPGALVTDQPGRFGMVSEARSFEEFLAYFEALEPGDVSVPMVRFQDEALEEAVQATAEHLWERALEYRESRRNVPIGARTKLRNTAPSTKRFTLGEWFGAHAVPAAVAQEEVTVVRSVFGAELVCAPSVGVRRFVDETLAQAGVGKAYLAGLAAFERPTTLAEGVKRVAETTRLDPESAREVVEVLAAGRFLQPENARRGELVGKASAEDSTKGARRFGFR